MELRGKTILITRAVSQSEQLRVGLQAAGAMVLECPAIEIVPSEDWTEVDRAVAKLHTYDWLIFTSTNAVDYFMQRVSAVGVKCNVPIAVVGAATAARLSLWNLVPSLVPKTFRAEGLLDEFPQDLRNRHILLPRAAAARELLPEELRRRGATVDVVTVYHTVKSAGLSDLRATLSQERIDGVVFTSPSAVRFFSETLGDDLVSCLTGIPIAVIGPIVAEAVEAVGLTVAIEAKRATIQDLIEVICSYFSNREPST